MTTIDYICVDSVLEVSALVKAVLVWCSRTRGDALTHLVQRKEEVDDLAITIRVLDHCRILETVNEQLWVSGFGSAHQYANDVGMSISASLVSQRNNTSPRRT